uniref:Polyprotein n=1 Tax=Oryza sativa subsp. japonica TaxID=39947 RepID=Q7Y1L4_ORYSJ|nr:putative polyprotein [Oryza sativa Japonica Group]
MKNGIDEIFRDTKKDAIVMSSTKSELQNERIFVPIVLDTNILQASENNQGNEKEKKYEVEKDLSIAPCMLEECSIDQAPIISKEEKRDTDNGVITTQGMGGAQNQRYQQGNNNRVPDDPYAKVKFKIPSFSGYYDAEKYSDWEMIVEQKFSAHLVPDQHRVRQASSEFKDFAIMWWARLADDGILPTTWKELKVAMRDIFVPPSYLRDLSKKLMRLEQRDKSVQDYYGELQKGLMRCSIVKGTEDSICRFYMGLRRKIQDIVDNKEFNTVNQLFQFAMLAVKELQGRDQQVKNKASTYIPRAKPSLGLPKPISFWTTPLASKRPVASGVSAAPKPPSPRPAVSGKGSSQVSTKSASSIASTGRTSRIRCHHCHGFGHVQKICPSQRAYVATVDCYICTSDVEDVEVEEKKDGEQKDLSIAPCMLEECLIDQAPIISEDEKKGNDNGATTNQGISLLDEVNLVSARLITRGDVVLRLRGSVACSFRSQIELCRDSAQIDCLSIPIGRSGPNILIIRGKRSEPPLSPEEEVKFEASDCLFRGALISVLADNIVDVYMQMPSRKDMWDALEAKFGVSDAGSELYAMEQFYDYKMVDDRSIVEQAHEIQMLAKELENNNCELPDKFVADGIIAKLLPSWSDFATSLKHKRQEFSVSDLIGSLGVEEKARAKDNRGKKVEGGSSANMLQKKNPHASHNNKKVKADVKPKATTNFKKKGKGKAKGDCFVCGKSGHWAKDCPERKDRKSANMVISEGRGTSGYGKLLPTVLSVFHSPDWWVDTGANIHFTSGKTVQLKNVQHVSSIKKNLVSGSLLCREGFRLVFESNKCVVSKYETFIGKGYDSGGLFRFSLDDDEALRYFKTYKAEVENQLERKIKRLRSDRGGEYFSNEFTSFCEEFGIIHEMTPPYSPQSNGVAERKNRTLTEMVNAMLDTAGLSKEWWGEAVLTACHVLNKIPMKHKEVTPFEEWERKKLNLSYLRTWGCLAKVNVPIAKKHKLGPNTVDCVFLGYAIHSVGYRFLIVNYGVPDMRVGTIIESRDATFFDNEFAMKNTPSTSSQETVIPHKHFAPIEHNDQTPEGNPEEDNIVDTRKSKRQRVAKSFGDDNIVYLVDGTPRTIEEAYSSPDADHWKEAVRSEMDSIMSNGTWEVVERPYGCKPVGCKWVFKKKLRPDGTIEKYKARLVAKGYTQKEGEDFFDTYSPVARLTTIRVLLALAASHGLLVHQMDVKTAFLNGELEEEIYMDQPDGYVLEGQERMVCKLLKSLYGLKQAPKQWHEKFDTTLTSVGFVVNEVDKCVYYRYGGGEGVILCLYVDDILIFGTSLNVIEEVKYFLSKSFEMKDLGEVDVIFNIKLLRGDEGGITLVQSHQVDKILSRFGYSVYKPAPTPYDPSVLLRKNRRIARDQLRYSQIIGSLMYLASATRPDISFVVSKLSRFVSNPGDDHWHALERVMCYQKGTMGYGIHYTGYSKVLEGYSDSNLISDADEIKATSGYVFTLGGGAVS